VGTLAGAATLGLLIPPSIIMIVYGVAADVSIAKLFMAGVLPGMVLAALFMGYIVVWALRHPGRFRGRCRDDPARRSCALAPPDPGGAADRLVLGSIYSGVATATEAAAIGVPARCCWPRSKAA
jgi:C4-dicarboxylate transporter DctM subunit